MIYLGFCYNANVHDAFGVTQAVTAGGDFGWVG